VGCQKRSLVPRSNKFGDAPRGDADKGRAPAGVWAGALYILPAEHGGRVGGRLFAQRAKRSFVPGNRVELFLISAQDPAGLPMDHVDLPASESGHAFIDIAAGLKPIICDPALHPAPRVRACE
jgi:hypothetical protein